MTRLIYIAHPIDQVKQPGNQPDRMRAALFVDQLVADLIRELKLAGASTYDPASAFRLGIGDTLTGAEQIAGINREALNRSAGLVAVLPAGVVTIGTIVEIEQAIRESKPTLLVVDDDLYKRSVQVRDWTEQIGVVCVRTDFSEEDAFGYSTQLRDNLQDLIEAEWLPEPITRQIPVRLDDGARMPSRSYGNDAGFDLYCNQDQMVFPGEFVDIPTGVAAAIPDGYWGLIIGRSSTWRTLRLNVILGVIDAGYRGELFAAVHNPGKETQNIRAGDRLAQLIILPQWAGSLLAVDDLPPSARGNNGFGSSGR